MINGKQYEYKKRPILRNLTNAMSDVKSAIDGINQNLEMAGVKYYMERALAFCETLQATLDLTEKQKRTGRVYGK